MRWRNRSDPCALMGPQHRWIAWSHKRLRTEVMMMVDDDGFGDGDNTTIYE